MKNIIRTVIIAIVVALLAVFALREAYIGIYFAGPNGKSFGDEKIEAFLPPLPNHISTALDVLYIANKAFSDINSDKDKYGKLSIYAIDNENVTTEEHTVQLISAHFDEKSGYMWVLYYQTGFNSSGEVIYGNGTDSLFGKILSRWELENINDEWVVVDIKEQP